MENHNLKKMSFQRAHFEAIMNNTHVWHSVRKKNKIIKVRKIPKSYLTWNFLNLLNFFFSLSAEVNVGYLRLIRKFMIQFSLPLRFS